MKTAVVVYSYGHVVPGSFAHGAVFRRRKREALHRALSEGTIAELALHLFVTPLAYSSDDQECDERCVDK